MALATTRNEDLLAILIAEGLTSRQIVTVSWLSEDAAVGDEGGQLPTLKGHMADRPH